MESSFQSLVFVVEARRFSLVCYAPLTMFSLVMAAYKVRPIPIKFSSSFYYNSHNLIIKTQHLAP
jgi:hypothetical protein